MKEQSKRLVPAYSDIERSQDILMVKFRVPE